MLVGAMNPCPCGYYGDPTKECTCPESMVSRYQKRISGPLLDRIDIQISVPALTQDELMQAGAGEASAALLYGQTVKWLVPNSGPYAKAIPFGGGVLVLVDIGATAIKYIARGFKRAKPAGTPVTEEQAAATGMLGLVGLGSLGALGTIETPATSETSPTAETIGADEVALRRELDAEMERTKELRGLMGASGLGERPPGRELRPSLVR